VGHDRNLDPEQRRANCTSDELRETGVRRMDDDRDASRQELGASRVDEQVVSPADAVERQAMVEAVALAVFELGLGDRGAEVDIPERRRLRVVRLSSREKT
jgi:hypothetical protein